VAVSPDFRSDKTVFAGVQGGILHSVDGGKNWYAAILPSPPPLISALAVSPDYARDGTVFASTMEDGVFRSSDRGSTWVAWNFGLLDLNVFCLAVSPAFADDETLLVGTESGIFRSTNGARAWREVDFPTEWAPVLSLALSPRYPQDGVLFAGTESAGLFCSRDRGRTWERLGEEVVTDGAVNGLIVSPEYPARPHLLALLNEALFFSRDGGRQWEKLALGKATLRDPVAGDGMASVAAPQGLGSGAPLLIGLADGSVLRIVLR
jgi:photosystem II stability/assembly factor-like uncharacterized protein